MPKKIQSQSHSLGARGEHIVSSYLESRGFLLLGRNVRAPAGSGVRGEIDIVCLSQNRVHLVEVKTRSSADFGDPAEFVSTAQARRLHRVWRACCAGNARFRPYRQAQTQVDIASIVLAAGQKTQLTVYWNAGMQDLT